MNKQGPIILIEENQENRLLFEQIFSTLKLKNSLLCFTTFREARNFIISEKLKPFLLFSNVLQFTEDSMQTIYRKDLFWKLKCPCLFFSILFTQSFVIDTFSIPKKSYFSSPYSENKFIEIISNIVKYYKLTSLRKIGKTEKETKKI